MCCDEYLNENPAAGECPDCGNRVDKDGETTLPCCNWSPVECKTCDWRPCDQSC